MSGRQAIARAAGTFYILNIVTILLSIAVRRFPTAHFALEIASTASSVVVAALLYEVFKPVQEAISLVAAFFRLTACAVALVGYVFKPAANMVIIFFGFHFVAIGYLLYKAGYRVLGAWACFAGFAAFVFFVPAVATRVFPVFAAIGLLTEVSLAAWLLTARLDAAAP